MKKVRTSTSAPARGPGKAPLALERLWAEEARDLLRCLLTAHPDLQCEAEQLARSLVGELDLERVADEVEDGLRALDLDDLNDRAGAHNSDYTEPSEECAGRRAYRTESTRRSRRAGPLDDSQIAESEEVRPGIVLDFDAGGRSGSSAPRLTIIGTLLRWVLPVLSCRPEQGCPDSPIIEVDTGIPQRAEDRDRGRHNSSSNAAKDDPEAPDHRKSDETCADSCLSIVKDGRCVLDLEGRRDHRRLAGPETPFEDLVRDV